METTIEDFKADEGPQNVWDAFQENDKLRVFALIEQLHDLSISADDFEHAYEEYAEIFSKYQEQPHLLDRSLEEIVSKIIPYLQDAGVEVMLKHRAAKYLYQICKVRTFKAFGKNMPHEVRHLPSVLSLVEQQDLEDWQNWETRYIGILWLSLLVLNPFDLSRLDTSEEGCPTTMERIYNVCQVNCLKDDSCTPVAAFLVARFLIRNDVKKVCLEKFFDWAIVVNDEYSVDAKIGPLTAVACILKHGKREDLLSFVERLCEWVLHLDYETISKNFKIYKTCIKICQRLGLVLLPPKVAKWRYQRGARSLLANVQKTVTLASLMEVQQTESIPECTDEENAVDDEEVPGEIEEIIERLLLGLKGNSTIVRWSSAKGIGRITNRLPKLLGDEVVSSVIELLNPLEQDDAWHGACLALAELAKRGLLLPSRLAEIVPLLLQALVYDEMQGYRNVGQNIRDAACYMSWAFARAYHPSVLQPFVERIASALLVTAVFDREINCRRAASAAFQESVGRLGNFPHGISILTTADFFSVAVRSNAFLSISEYIAQFEEYKYNLIEHLVTRKINHWDTNIRELSSLALSNLTKHAPLHMRDTIVPRLFQLSESTELNTRHGAVLALGEVISSLQKISALGTNADAKRESCISADIGELAGQLIGKYRERGQFKGMSGTYMKHACASFIRNCSEAMLPLTKREYVESWQLLLDESVIDEKASTREQATQAFSKFCATYYRIEPEERLGCLIDNYIKDLLDTQIEHKAQGIVSALGALPLFVLEIRLREIVQVIDIKTIVPEMYAVGYNHSEMRRDCIRALMSIVDTVGFTHSSSTNEILCGPVYGCYLRALEEYALDNRGDIGSWVREASINALYAFLTKCPAELMTVHHVQNAMVAIAKQSVERIDKIRAVAGKTFTALIYHEPQIPHLKARERLQEIFPRDTTEVLWLFPHHTFPLFIELLSIPEYVEHVSAGLILSVGAPTESLHTCASKMLNDYLKTHQSFVEPFGTVVLKILKERTMKDPLFISSTFQFLAELLSSSTNSKILLAGAGMLDFAEPIFNLVNNLVTHTKKHIDSIPVYCALMLAPKICKRVLSKLVVYLGMVCVNIRRETALKMYETLLVYGDQTCIPEETLDEVLVCLSEEKWDGELDEARQIRNRLCTLMDIKTPVTKIKK
ncbi:tubulin-specific chaperone D [Anopheles ziemanni]|uniref:tubulin-specific chaperone D n=1 Tax=Anopheles coustani TaxID=139045 RepID=UPI00265AE09A|nr:tubulin-specific chaperone D [Anopheles coustani]XP_058168735.1 tubulin-specific chaperone D [Anopheles ziemanni]